MEKIGTVVVALLFAGCAVAGGTLMSVKRDCDTRSTMRSVSECLNAAQTPEASTYSKRFFMKAEQLAGKVENKEISEADGRLALEEYYGEVMAQMRQHAQQIQQATPRPQTTNCIGYGNAMRCTTY